MKIRNNFASEQIQKDLEKYFSESKFSISFKLCEMANEFLKQITSQFSLFNNLLVLQIKVKQQKIFEFSIFLRSLKQVHTLESLTIKLLQKDSFVDKECSISVGESIEHMVNLKHLQISINCLSLLSSTNMFKLENAYQKLSLNSLCLKVQNIKKQNEITQSLYKGLGRQVNLSSLTIKLQDYQLFKDYGMKILKEELLNLINLRELKLHNYNSFYYIQQYQSFSIGQIIKYLTNLESLSVVIPISAYKDQCYLDGIQSLVHLKSVNFDVANSVEFSLLERYLNVISLCPGLQSISLNIKISNRSLKIEYLQKLISILSKFKYIEQLRIQLDYIHELSYEFFQNLMLSLNKQINLKKLSLSYSDNIISKDQIQELNHTILPSLEEIDIFIQESDEKSISQNFPANFWISILNYIPSLKKVKFLTFQDEELICMKHKVQLGKLKADNFNDINLNLGQFYSYDSNEVVSFLNSFQSTLNMQNLSLKINGQNEFNDDILLSFREASQNMKSLTKLEIGFGKENQFTLQGLSLFGEGLSNLVSLKLLDFNLESINLGNGNAGVLFRSLKNMLNLKKVNIILGILNNINHEQSIEISEIIEFPSRLQKLQIQITQNGLTFFHIKPLISGLISAKNLKNLNLKMNLAKLKKHESEYLYNIFSNLKSCKKILINFHQILQINLEKLYQCLAQLKYIELNQEYDEQHYGITIEKEQKNYEDLSRNDKIAVNFKYQYQIESEDIEFLSEYFTFSKISFLDLQLNDRNKLNSSLGNQLFSAFEQLKTLHTLNLNVCEYSGLTSENLNQFGQIIKNLESLVSLNIKLNSLVNHFDLSEARNFNKGFEDLPNVKHLQISLTSCSQLELNLLFSSIGLMKSLRDFSFDVQHEVKCEKGFYQFSPLSFICLQSLRVCFMNRQKQNQYKLQFYESMKHLQNLRCLTIRYRQYDLRNFYKIIKLVKIKEGY